MISAASIANRANVLRSKMVHNNAYRVQPYSDEWYTPPEIPAALGPFDLDPCAGPMHHARRNLRPPIDGLRAKWTGRVWCNPPYTNVHEWMECFIRHANGIALVNARPETAWFQRLAAAAEAMLFLKGRLTFGTDGPVNGRRPPVGSVLIAIGPGNADALRRCKLPGILVTVDRPG